MQSRHLVLACLFAVAACQQRVEPTESVESLVSNPDRLAELREKCRQDHASVGDVQCNRVAEATRQRFLGKGGSPYAADPLAPAKPDGGADAR
jgi:hypothetical protein